MMNEVKINVVGTIFFPASSKQFSAVDSYQTFEAVLESTHLQAIMPATRLVALLCMDSH